MFPVPAMGRWRETEKPWDVGISPFFLSGFCSLSLEKLKIFAQIFFPLSRFLLYVPIILASGGGAVWEVGRIQVPGQPGQVREPLSQDKDMKTRTKCCSMAENLQGLCETLHSVLKMTKRSECILKLLSLLFLIQRLESKFLYLLSRQTLFQ